MKLRADSVSFLTILFAIVFFLHFTIAQVFLPNLANIYYLVLGLCLLFTLNNNKVNYLLFPLIISSAVSIIFSQDLLPDSVLRWISWVGLLIVAGPVLYNKKINQLRENLLWCIIYIFLIITVVSFFWILFRLPSFKVNTEVYSVGRKYFRNGISLHEMTLAPIGGISAIYSIYSLVYFKGSKLVKTIYIGLLFLSIGVMLMASSRIVLASFLVTLVFFFRNKIKFLQKSTKRNFGVLMFLLLIIIPFLSSLPDYFNNFLENNSRLESKGTNNSREGLWQARFLDFQINPFTGVGFYSVSKEVINNHTIRTGINKQGQIEFGSLYLQTLSTMGLAGFLSLLYILIKVFNIGISISKYEKAELYSTLLVFLILHSFAEAYAFSSGAILCIFMWLLMSQVVSLKYSYRIRQIIAKNLKLKNSQLETETV
ncbi:hypothetical protein GO755_20995 [Spirosoma sp. HMF4905]|uniref:O-antigen ligase-related domain-containing protein n=1 Tax=Spirosoma arboris TaxID=2682092 RepID=A0A7K1SFH2_9BACT|nr:O-antigen ligase family protein [Spirosoma arboris]MVM32531.1 hypothetical protein [Spirosoma arboris]